MYYLGEAYSNVATMAYYAGGYVGPAGPDLGGVPANYWYWSAIQFCGSWPNSYHIGIYIPPSPRPNPQGSKAIYPGSSVAVNRLVDRTCEVGNPCRVGSGLKSQAEPDYIGSGPHPLSFTRLYRSGYLVPPANGFGGPWMHQWQRRLDLSRYFGTAPAISVLRGDGGFGVFERNDVQWTQVDGRQLELTELKDSLGKNIGWRLTDVRSGSTEEYDAAGKLLSVREQNGWLTTLQYSDSATPASVAPHKDLLIGVRNAFDRTLQLSYHPDGRIAKVVLPGGKELHYGYDSSGYLDRVLYPDGRSRRYHYESAQYRWALTGITDEAGVRFATYGYDTEGRVISSERAGGIQKVQLQYESPSRTKVVFAGGFATSFGFELFGNVLRPTSVSAPCLECGSTAKASSYDAFGNLASSVSFDDLETRFAYDARGRETMRTEGYGTASPETTTTEWHPTWALPVKVAAPNRVDYFSYDGGGRLIGYAWFPTNDANGSQGLNATPAGVVSSTGWTYDSNGLVIATIKTVDGTVTGQWTYTYDAQGQLLTITDAAGTVARAIQYDDAGHLVEATNLDGEHLRYRYNDRGYLTSFELDGRVITYEYDPIGFLTAVRGQNGYYTGYVYDAAHRLTTIHETPVHGGPSNVSSPLRVQSSSDAGQHNGPQSITVWRSAWVRLMDWITSWISPARAQAAPPVPRPIPAWPSHSQAPQYQSFPEDDLFGGRHENPNAILQWAGKSLRDLASRTTEALTCDEDPRCTRARQDAQAAYHELTTKRLPQYLSGGTGGSNAGHRQAILQKQATLKDAIRRVKLHCKTSLPLELPEWERTANMDVPILY